MTKVTIETPNISEINYPKIMVNCISGSIYWFQRECVAVLLKRGELEIADKKICTMYSFPNMECFVDFNYTVLLRND